MISAAVLVHLSTEQLDELFESTADEIRRQRWTLAERERALRTIQRVRNIRMTRLVSPAVMVDRMLHGLRSA